MTFEERAEKPAEMIWMMAAGYLAGSGMHGDLVKKLEKKFLEIAKHDIKKALRQVYKQASVKAHNNGLREAIDVVKQKATEGYGGGDTIDICDAIRSKIKEGEK